MSAGSVVSTFFFLVSDRSACGNKRLCFNGKYEWEDRAKASRSVPAWANLGQYIHHTFFTLLLTASWAGLSACTQF